MFNISELLVIVMVALIVIGPKQLPAVAYQLGKLIKIVTGFIDQFKREFQKQADLEHNLTRAQEAEAKPHSND